MSKHSAPLCTVCCPCAKCLVPWWPRCTTVWKADTDGPFLSSAARGAGLDSAPLAVRDPPRSDHVHSMCTYLHARALSHPLHLGAPFVDRALHSQKERKACAPSLSHPVTFGCAPGCRAFCVVSLLVYRGYSTVYVLSLRVTCELQFRAALAAIWLDLSVPIRRPGH